MLPISSAQRKLSRGVEHVHTLQHEAAMFQRAGAYQFRAEKTVRSPREVHCRCFSTEVESPPEHWPLLAGEAIQNLRSALDHAIYPLANDPEHSQFPICLNGGDFRSETKDLKRELPEPIFAGIKAAQPFVEMPHARTHHALAVLAHLSNVDKHRMLAAVAGAVAHEAVGTNVEVAIKWHKTATWMPLTSGEVEISNFTVRSEHPFHESDVGPEFSYDVHIEERTLDVLRGIAHRVFEMVTLCETGSMPGPFAPYPVFPLRP